MIDQSNMFFWEAYKGSQDEAIAYDKGVNFARKALNKMDDQPEIIVQPVWRNYNESHNSFYVWDILEVIGEPFDENYFIKCRDGSFILINCYHTFGPEKAQEMLYNHIDQWQMLTIIGDESRD